MGWRKMGVMMGLMMAIVFLTVPTDADGAIQNGPVRKFGRGLGNIATGWLEMFYQITQETERSGSIAGVAVGFPRGVLFGVGRTIVGAFELVTFPAPNPTVGYGPIIEPEFVTFRDADRR